MRIAYICDEYPPVAGGGLGVFVQSLARGIVRLGHEAIVLGWGERDEEREDEGVLVRTFRGSRTRTVSWLLNRLELRRRLALTQCDVVEAPEYMGPLPFGLPGRRVLLRIHLAATTIARERGDRPAVYASWCERNTLLRFRRWASSSREAARQTTETFGIAPRKVDVVLPPVERPARPIPPTLEGEYVLFAGGVTERKGALALAQAAPLFLRDGVRLVYAGALAEGIKERIAAAAGARNVVFLGRIPREELFGLMERARAFAFPSRLESFGLVVAEAMLAGAPVVTSALPPFTEFVRDGETGILVDPMDPDAIGSAVARALDAPGDLGANARAWAERELSVEAVAEKNLALYREVAAAQPAGALA